MTAIPLPRSRRVLVVDDSALNREMLTDFIELLGHEVSLAENGAAGLESMSSNPPDVVLLDLDMPVMSGMDVLERVSEDELLRHIPIIVISGRDDMEHVVKALALGATDFLGKPFNPPLLEARLQSSIEKKDLRDRERALLHSLEKSYADLRVAEASRDALTHMIVHDLGNPLSVISMNTEMLQMMSSGSKALPAENLQDRLQHLANAAHSMGTMIRTILDVSKLESDQMPVELASVDLLPLLERVVEPYRAAAAERSMEIDCSSVPPGLCCNADPALLERIISNLISNALRYAEGATRFGFAVMSHNDKITLQMEDDGAGIPTGLHDRIFDKYFQVNAEADRVGTGLGLAFCRMAAEAMGGGIKAAGIQPRGTRFELNLPACDLVP